MFTLIGTHMHICPHRHPMHTCTPIGMQGTHVHRCTHMYVLTENTIILVPNAHMYTHTHAGHTCIQVHTYAHACMYSHRILQYWCPRA